MSLETVLNYDSLAEVRDTLSSMNAKPLLQAFYQAYEAHQLPSQREATFRRQYATHSNRAQSDPDNDEIRSFASNLCHSIWVEQHAGLPWSLKDYSRKEIRFLLQRYTGMEGWGSSGKGSSGHWGVIHAGSQVRREPVADEWYKLYPLALHLAGREADSGQTVERFLSWVMANFFHAYGRAREDWGWDKYPSANRNLITLAELFQQRIVGCHTAAKILTALLRSVNIPAREVDYDGHGVCYLPSLDRYVHGDFLADWALLKDNTMLLMTLSELETWLLKDRGYLSFEIHLMNKVKDPYSIVQLRRTGPSLFVSSTEDPAPAGPAKVPSLPEHQDAGYYTALQVRLPEFGIHEINGKYYSRLVPIRGLDDVPACGLALTIALDAGRRVVITLENRGFALPGNQGILLIEIDGVTRGGYDLPRIDQGFVRGGGQTDIRTNFKIGADEHGVVRATLTRLAPPCREVKAMRHLGKPFPVGTADPQPPLVTWSLPGP